MNDTLVIITVDLFIYLLLLICSYEMFTCIWQNCDRVPLKPVCIVCFISVMICYFNELFSLNIIALFWFVLNDKRDVYHSVVINYKTLSLSIHQDITVVCSPIITRRHISVVSRHWLLHLMEIRFLEVVAWSDVIVMFALSVILDMFCLDYFV